MRVLGRAIRQAKREIPQGKSNVVIQFNIFKTHGIVLDGRTIQGERVAFANAVRKAA